jgi:hypothetical protein
MSSVITPSFKIGHYSNLKTGHFKIGKTGHYHFGGTDKRLNSFNKNNNGRQTKPVLLHFPDDYGMIRQNPLIFEVLL